MFCKPQRAIILSIKPNKDISLDKAVALLMMNKCEKIHTDNFNRIEIMSKLKYTLQNTICTAAAINNIENIKKTWSVILTYLIFFETA